MSRLIILTAILFWGCTTLPEDEFQLQPTEMKVKVLDESFKQVSSATVAIYRDYYSFATRTGAVAVADIDNTGYASFTNLEPVNYFIYAQFKIGDTVYDNEDITYNLLDYLTENAISYITVATKKRREETPTKAIIQSIDVIPVAPGANWKNVVYDSIFGEVVVIKNYNFDWSEITAATSKITLNESKNVKFGTNLTSYFGIDPVEMDLSNLKPFFSFDEEQGDSFALIFSMFAKSADFNNRNSIFDFSASATGRFDIDYLDISNEIISSLNNDFPYAPAVFIGKTSSLNFDYYCYAKIKWE